MSQPSSATAQQQFLDVIDRDEAERRLHAAINLQPLGPESVPIDAALGRVLAADVLAGVDVPSFDRSNLDGFAVRAADTYGAAEQAPRRLKLLDEVISTGVVPQTEVKAGTAVAIATGGMLPRGADAIVMIEHAEPESPWLAVRRPVTPGFGVTFAGTDIAAGEIVLRSGQLLTSRETGVLAAIGVAGISVWKRPRVAILSTGDEVIAPGEPMEPGKVYDSNARILADAVIEAGGTPTSLGIAADDVDQLREIVAAAVSQFDLVVLSGGTSKGAGDVCYLVVRELDDPGIVAHGVALKPGKPICLAATGGKPVIVLPGFPTSAVFTFHEFVAPIIRRLAGLTAGDHSTVRANMAVKVNSEIGRTEFLLVGLVNAADDGSPHETRLVAYPMGKGSGSVTTFSGADGFLTIGRHEEIVEAGAEVSVRLLGQGLQVADLVVVGSHCPGLDLLLGRVQAAGFRTKFLPVGSTAGLAAAQRGECDVAGLHLYDAETQQYNRPFLTRDLELIPGYGRLQGVVFRAGDQRFAGCAARDAIAAVQGDETCMMVNRNPGSGTRILIDQLLSGVKPNGYAIQARSHNSVAAAVLQGRADWGIAIEPVARRAQLGFLPIAHEQFDFVIPKSRGRRPAVALLRELLSSTDLQQDLRRLGMEFREAAQ